MDQGGISTTKDLPPAKPKVLRARSLPSSRPFNVAAFFSAMHYFGLITTATAFVLFFMEPSQLATKVIVGGLVFSGVTWMIAFFKRRSAQCPLCKGTPLINSGALAHSRATRLFPLNHGVSATLSILATQTFRCMYCGSDFDLLKTPSYQRGRQEDGSAE
ncbi:MAG: hypothetical protein V4819_01565 [Verrucomicrobiota bacterium]